MSTAAFAALTALVFVIPWENSLALPGVGSIARLVGVAAVLLGVTSVALSGSLRRPHPFHVIATMFLCWSALSLSWAIDIGTTLSRTASYALLLAMVWLMWQFGRTESRQLAFLQAYVAGAYIPALDAIRNYLVGHSARHMRFSASNFNPNEIAMILVLGIPIAWYLCLSSKRRAVSLFNAAYLPFAILAALLTGSRGGFLSALVALLLIPWSLERLSVRARLGMIVLLAASVVGIASMVPHETWDRLGETAGHIEQGDFSDRQILWAAALDVFLEHPILGVGAGGYGSATQPKGWLREASPHQTFLSVLVGQGLVGLTLFLAMFLAACWSIPRMPGLHGKFWIILMLTLLVGLLPRTWDYAKPPWFVLGVLTAQSALVRRGDRRLGARPPQVVPRDPGSAS